MPSLSNVQLRLLTLLWMLLALHEVSASALIDREIFAHETSIVDVALSPNGESIAVVRKTPNSFYEIWRISTSNLTAVKRTVLKTKGEILWFNNSMEVLVVAKSKVTRIEMSGSSPPKLVARLKHNESLFVEGPHRAENLLVSGRTADRKKYQVRPLISTNSKALTTYEFPVAQRISAATTSMVYAKISSSDSAKIISAAHDGSHTLFDCSLSTLKNPCHLLGTSANPDVINIIGRFQSDLSGLYQYSTKSREFRLIHQDPAGIADIERVNLDHQGQPLMAYYRGLTNHWFGLQPSARHVLQQLPDELRRVSQDIQCADQLSACLIVAELPNKLDREYHLYRNNAASIQAISLKSVMGVDDPLIDYALEVMVKPIVYETSDGMTQYAYLYLPENQSPDDIPLVVYPHGGPHSRDYYHSNRIALFIASRGYAVLKPNFRGSTGFGLRYMQASNNQFGRGRVLDDILQATDHVQESGVGKNKPMAIVGESFGGFAAISSATFDQRFSVAIAAMPPLDIGRVRSSIIARQVRPKEIQNLTFLWGDLNNEALRVKLHEDSPLNHAALLNTPLFLWAGAQDPIVPVSHVKDYALLQWQNKKRLSLMIDNRSKHGPSSGISMLSYMAMIEQVLSYYVEGDAQAIDSPKLKRHMANMLTQDSTDWFSSFIGAD